MEYKSIILPLCNPVQWDVKIERLWIEWWAFSLLRSKWSDTYLYKLCLWFALQILIWPYVIDMLSKRVYSYVITYIHARYICTICITRIAADRELCKCTLDFLWQKNRRFFLPDDVMCLLYTALEYALLIELTWESRFEASTRREKDKQTHRSWVPKLYRSMYGINLFTWVSYTALLRVE